MTQIWRHTTRNRVARSSIVLCLCLPGAGWSNGYASATDSASVVAEGERAYLIHLGYSQSLKALLFTISHLLDDILQVQRTLIGSPDPSLRDAAHTLMDGYVMFGLDTDLSAAELSQGILDCDTALQILKDRESELDLTSNEILDLDETLNEIKLELEYEL